MTDDDFSIDEKRVFSSKAGKTEVFVATGVGVVAVDVSGDRVGGFRIDHRCTARDVAGRDGRIAVATDEDVLLAPGYEPTGFGPAACVGLTADRVVALGEDGRVGTLPFEAPLDGESTPWRTVGTVAGGRAVDGRLVATDEGVVRLGSDRLRPAGLSAVNDVAAAGPFAATDEGLFYLGNGWMTIDDGSWTVVDAAVDGDRAHAAGLPGVRRQTGTDRGAWEAVSDDFGTDGEPVGFAYGDGFVCAVTAAGGFVVDAGDGPRTQALGLRDVGGVAVP
jgi:hypothetical protein